MDGEAVEDRKATLVDVGVGLWLIAVQVILFSLMRTEGDPFDSRLFWWTWLIFPILALLATFERPWGARPLWWTACLIAPFMLEVALFGTILHDPDEGVSFWLFGEFVLFVLGVVTFLAAVIGFAIRKARDPALQLAKPW